MMSDDEEETNEAIDLIPLEEGVLTLNIGMPVVIVCCNSNLVVHGEMVKYYKES